MAAPSPVLPRGTRIKVGTVGSLEKILFGPATVSDGSQNLVGALRQSMAALGARTLRDLQAAELGVRAGRRDRRASPGRAEAGNGRARGAARRLGDGRSARDPRARERAPRRGGGGLSRGCGWLLLVAAGEPDADWARNLETEPACRATIGDRTFEATAERLDGTEAAQAVVGLILKYGRPPSASARPGVPTAPGARLDP
jgi:hypothetical protein